MYAIMFMALLGLSSNGGMYGAGVFVYWKNGSSWVLEERFASGFYTPNFAGTIPIR